MEDKIMTIPIGYLGTWPHTLCEFLAFFIAYRYYKFLKNKGNSVPLSLSSEWRVIIGGAAGALLGSRAVGALENPMLFLHPPSWIYYLSTKTILGGLAGGIIGVEIAKKTIGLRIKTGDYFVYPLILGMVIGRIGCFLTGVSDGTVGLPSPFILAFDQGDGIARHPTSLYEIVFLILIWIVIASINDRKIRSGDRFRIFIIGYFIFRIMIEFLKPRHPFLYGLSMIQWVAIIGIVPYSLYFFNLRGEQLGR